MPAIVYNMPMNIHRLAAFVGISLFLLSTVQAPAAEAPVTLRYHFTPGQTLRYLVQRDPYFANPAAAIAITDPRTAYRPPVVERLTEKVLAVDAEGTATIRVTVGPEPGFEDASNPLPTMTRTVQVTPWGEVLTPATDSATLELLRAFFRLPSAPVALGASWKGTAFRGTSHVETQPTLAAQRGGSRGLAVITQEVPATVTESRSPDHDGTLLQTTRSAQADRVVFDVGSGTLRRQASTMTVTLSLTMTERGARGAADFGRVIPNVQVVQTMTIDRQEDQRPQPKPAVKGRTLLGR